MVSQGRPYLFVFNLVLTVTHRLKRSPTNQIAFSNPSSLTGRYRQWRLNLDWPTVTYIHIVVHFFRVQSEKPWKQNKKRTTLLNPLSIPISLPTQADDPTPSSVRGHRDTLVTEQFYTGDLIILEIDRQIDRYIDRQIDRQIAQNKYNIEWQSTSKTVVTPFWKKCIMYI